MPWKTRTTPPVRILDMPTPPQLGAEGALPGWVWTTAGGEDMELLSYSLRQATWRDQRGNKIVVDENGQRTRVEATA